MGVSGKSENAQKIWNTAYGLSSGSGLLAFSRTHETEADKLGLVFMIMAGYKGSEAAEVWIRMSEKTKGRKTPPQILSTHPSNETRIKTLKTYLPEAARLAKLYNEQSNYKGK